MASGGRVRSLAHAVRSSLERLRSTVEAIRQAVPAADLAWELAVRFRRNNGAVLAGFLAYRMFIWFVPLALVLVAGVGFSTATNLDLVRFATEYGVSGTTASDAVDQAQRGRVAALAIGLAALGWTTIGLIRGVHYVFAQAWGMAITPRRGLIRHAGFFMVTAIVLVLLFAAVGALQRQGPVFALLGTAGSFTLVGASLFAVCWTMPRRTTRWLDLVPGVAVGTLATAGVQTFAAIYFPQRIASASAVYGGLGVAIAVLFYMFLIGYMLVGTAFVNSVWTDRAEIIAGRPWVLDPDGLPRWLRRPARWASARQDRDPGDAPARPDELEGGPGRDGSGTPSHPSPESVGPTTPARRGDVDPPAARARRRG